MKTSLQSRAPLSPEAAFRASRLGRDLEALSPAGTPSNQAIARYLLRNPVRVAAGSIEEVSASIPVSSATLSRFARTLGFTAYPELRAAVAATLEAILLPIEKLKGIVEGAPARAPLAEGLEATLASVQRTAESLEAARVDEAVRRIREARGLYVLGFGLSAHLAGVLSLGLQPFCPRLVNVVEFGGSEVAAGRLMGVGAGDLVIALSFPRYARDALQLAAYARDQGADILAVTDGPASPLARRAAQVLYAPSHHPVLATSLAAGLVVVEAVVAGFMASDRAHVGRAAKLTEAISAYLVRPDTARPRSSPKRRRVRG